jgi:hypothetical protein
MPFGHDLLLKYYAGCGDRDRLVARRSVPSLQDSGTAIQNAAAQVRGASARLGRAASRSAA